MAVLESVSGIADIISKMITEERKSYESVSRELKTYHLHPTLRGLSARSVRRYCESHGIHRSSRLNDQQLDVAVRSSVARVTLLLKPNEGLQV